MIELHRTDVIHEADTNRRRVEIIEEGQELRMAQNLNATGHLTQRLRELEGHRVSLVTADGSQIYDVVLVSAGGRTAPSVWLEMDGTDVFINHSQIAAAWDPHDEKAA